MKKSHILILLLMLTIAPFLSGCNSSSNSSDNNEVKAKADTIEVVASLFPQYDFTRTIAGEYASVTLLLPPGIESHSYEPTPKDIIKITESDLFLYTNALMEPWANAMIENSDSKHTTVVDLSAGITLIANTHSDLDALDENEKAHDEGEYDPHYWLDPQNAMIMVATIRDALIKEMPDKAEVFTANADALIKSLEELDKEIAAVIEKSDSKIILSGGHFAFGYFANRYGLENMSPYVGFSPDAEPTPQRIAELIDTIKTTGAKAIFYEELIDPKVARIISDEANVEMLLLHGAHNLSQDELESNITYIEIMKGNLERLKIGLGYHE